MRPAVEIDDRLVDHRESLGLQRLAQVALEHQAPRQPVLHRFVEDDRTRPAAVLGLVHRDVGALDDLRGILQTVAAGDDADARRRMNHAPLNLVGLRQDPQQPFGDQTDRGLGAQVGQQHREFVAAEARRDAGRLARGAAIGLPHAHLQAARDVAQQLIARRVAHRVVDQLEAVEVEEQHRKSGAAVGSIMRGRALQRLDEGGCDWADR